ncbi:hypothetical protein DFH29DRAFT_883903 [Suillus ampliporus]|nr:hypothetical protein DFH29DRAFT_883903 [Suillus ampliporus]
MNTFVMFATNVAIGCSTTNLMVRTWIIWENSYMMRLLLVLLSLGHWALLALFVATARASTQNGYAVLEFMINGRMMRGTSDVDMSYDLALLVFTVVGLWRMPSSSTLWRTLVKQGVIYFIVNLVALVVLLERINCLLSTDCSSLYTYGESRRNKEYELGKTGKRE